MLRSLLPALVLLLAYARPTAARQPHNFSITDQSPLISYAPGPAVGDGTSSWNVSYSNASWPAFNTNTFSYGSGQSFHWTRYSPASASFDFVGTAVYAWGNASDGSDALTVDGVEFNGSSNGITLRGTPGLLAFAENLTDGLHKVSLFYRGGGQVNLTGFTTTVSLDGDGTSPTQNTTLGVVGTSGNTSINTAFTASAGDWGVGYDGPGSGNSTQASLYTAHPYATVSFAVPTNTSFLLINGELSPVSLGYSVALSCSSSSTAGVYTAPGNQSFAPSSPWGDMNIVFYTAVLDPTATYNVEMEYTGEEGGVLGIDGATFISSSKNATTSASSSASTSGTSSPGSSTASPGSQTSTAAHGSNAGGIAGGVVGGLAALIAVGALIWFLRRRRRRESAKIARSGSDTTFEVDDYGEAAAPDAAIPMPYFDNPDAAYAGEYSAKLGPIGEVSAVLISADAAGLGAPGGADPGEEKTVGGPRQPQPTLSSQTPTSGSTHSPPSSQTDSRQTDSPSAGSYTPLTLAGRAGDQPKPAAARRGRGPRGGGAAAPVRPVHDVDAGRIQPEGVELLPPNYDPAWGRDREQEG